MGMVQIIQKHGLAESGKVRIIQHHAERPAAENTEEKAVNVTGKSTGRKTNWIAIIGLTAAMGIFAAVAVYNPKAVKKTVSHVFETKGERMVRKMVEKKQVEYQERNQQIYAKFQEGVQHAGEQDFQRASGNIHDTVKKLTSFKATAKMCWKMAKDKLFSTDDTGKKIQDTISRPILQPCANGCGKIQSEYETLAVRLAESRNQYYADVAQAAKELHIQNAEINLSGLAEHLAKLEQNTQMLAIDKFSIAVGAVLEAVFIRSTVAAFRSVCGHVVAKLAGSATAGAISAAADGPLPIGDAIGVVLFIGGAAWAAYDIYQVTKVLPGELRDTMRNMINDMQLQARQTVAGQGRKLMDAYEKELQEQEL